MHTKRPFVCGAALSLACGLAWGCLSPISLWADEPLKGGGPASADDVRIGTLLAQLGNPEFAARERATEQLIRIGMPALPALEGGLDQSDREIRYRCERILAIVREVDFRRRLNEFLNNPDKSDGMGLPSWESYRERIGEEPEARQIFVEMQKATPELLETLEHNPAATPEVVAARVAVLQQGLQNPTDRREPTVGAVAALLFAAGQENINIDHNTSSYVYQFVYQKGFREAITAGPQRETLRRLLGGWIRRADGDTAYQGMILAVHYELPEGLQPAIRTLSQPNLAQQHARLYAILVVAKLGNRRQIELLEQQLDDKLAYGGNQKINNVEYQSQMRDIALAALWHLVDEDPKDHGFDHIRPTPQTVFDVSSVGFANDESRQKALDDWKQFRAKQKASDDNGPAKEADAEADGS
ncbi:MAG: hypothetical protein KDA59_19020 [Planctomycetales bacterium]|nr:hypothetical protein [Planctomycetales bacterium]